MDNLESIIFSQRARERSHKQYLNKREAFKPQKISPINAKINNKNCDITTRIISNNKEKSHFETQCKQSV